MKKILMLIFVGLLVFSCGSRKSVTKRESERKAKKEQVLNVNKTTEIDDVIAIEEPSPKQVVKINSTADYISIFCEIAKQEMELYGIPASITLAQGILESNSGKGRLSVEANNHFGIKCHDWTGAKIYHDDDAAQECFRKYNNAKYSYRDHSLFLTTRKRYAKLFTLKKDDYKRWAKELKAAGYATDKKYPDKLISLIERYELYKFDEEILGNKKSYAKRNKQESIVTHLVVKGDTLYSISKKYNLSVEELQKLNDLKNTEIKIGQELYVSPD
jgi:flagellum-specific peptidoglycan hydrolase FlgJ